MHFITPGSFHGHVQPWTLGMPLGFCTCCPSAYALFPLITDSGLKGALVSMLQSSKNQTAGSWCCPALLSPLPPRLASGRPPREMACLVSLLPTPPPLTSSCPHTSTLPPCHPATLPGLPTCSNCQSLTWALAGCQESCVVESKV